MTPHFSDEQRADAEQIAKLLNISVFVVLVISSIEPLEAMRAFRVGSEAEPTLFILLRELFQLVPIVPAVLALREAKKICERVMTGAILDSVNAKSISRIETLLMSGLIWSGILAPLMLSLMYPSLPEQSTWAEWFSPAVLGYAFVMYALSRMFKIIVTAIPPHRGS